MRGPEYCPHTGLQCSDARTVACDCCAHNPRLQHRPEEETVSEPQPLSHEERQQELARFAKYEAMFGDAEAKQEHAAVCRWEATVRALETRQQEHLRLIRRLTIEAVSPEQAEHLRGQIAALTAEVGTLRAQIRELEDNDDD